MNRHPSIRRATSAKCRLTPLVDRKFLNLLPGIVAALVATVTLSGNLLAQEAAQTLAASVLQPQAYVSLQPVPRGRIFEIAVVGKISSGYHINAHEPSEEYLIPTKITADLPAGVLLVETTYPRGVMRAFRFSKTPLRVYESSFTVKMKLRAANTAAMGPQKIALNVGYQACNQDTCLPPTKVPVTAQLEIAAEDSPAHPANANIFAATPASKSSAQH